MKKLLLSIILLILFLITSCKNQDTIKIKCMKASCVEDLAYSNLTLYLNIYTTQNVESLIIAEHRYIEKAIICFKQQTKYQFDQDKESAFIYQLKLTFKNTIFTLSQINIYVNNTLQSVDIGLYQTVKINHNDTVTATTLINNDQLKLYLCNNLDRTIYLTKVEEYCKTKIMLTINKINMSEAYLYAGTTRAFNLSSLDIPDEYQTISGILKIEFTSNLKKYEIYTPYYLNNAVNVLKII